MAMEGYSGQHAIVIDNTKVSGSSNLTDFPVYLSGDNFLADAFSNSQGKEINSNYLLDDANLQGYWRLENTSYTDESSNGYDLSGTTRGAVTGKFGNGIDFESGSTDDISIADASCANLEITGSQTWSAWIKPESVGAANTVMSKYTSGALKHLALQAAGTMQFRLDGLTTDTDAISTSTLVAGNWYHVVGVYDSSAQEISIWVNGVKETTNTASGSATDTDGDFHIGNTTTATPRPFDGIIDDAAIWDRALSDEEVRTLYTGGADLRFSTDEAGTTQVPHEVVNWDIDNSEAEVHVKLPSVSYNSDTTFYVWYNNSSATPIGREIATMQGLKDDANLQAYWKFESDGTDETANSNDLTASGTITHASALFGNGIDWGASQNYSISGGSHTGISNTGDQTFSVWVKITGGTNYIYQNNGDGIRQCYFSTTSVTWRTDGLTGSSTSSRTGGVPDDGQWHHVILRYDSTAEEKSIWIDGVKETFTASGSMNDQSSYAFYIGGSSSEFQGDMDDYAIYDRALSDDEIQAIYGSGRGVWDDTYELVTHDLLYNSSNFDTTFGGDWDTSLLSAGKMGTARSFNGSSSSIDWDGSFTSGDTGEDLFMSVWVNPDDIGTAGSAFSAPFMVSPSEWGLNSEGTDGIYFRTYGGNNLGTSTNMSTGSWQHVAIKWDAGTDIETFLDGSSIDTTSETDTSTNSSEVTLGSNTPDNGGSVWYDGDMDEVRVRNTLPTDDYIATEYNNQNSPSTFAVGYESFVPRVA